MPLPPNFDVEQFGGDFLANRVKAYNTDDLVVKRNYNCSYRDFIKERTSGLAANAGSLAKWLNTQSAARAVWTLLRRFGMGRNSQLMRCDDAFAQSLAQLSMVAPVDAILLHNIPTDGLNVRITPEKTLSQCLGDLFDHCSKAGKFSASGGFVIASKTLHCLFPDLVPMIDGEHTGISYYNICRRLYLPPGGDWTAYLGYEFDGIPNPSPRGGGSGGWKRDQFLCAIGMNETIYQKWQSTNGNPGRAAFLDLDYAEGTTGVPRVVDKALW